MPWTNFNGSSTEHTYLQKASCDPRPARRTHRQNHAAIFICDYGRHSLCVAWKQKKGCSLDWLIGWVIDWLIVKLFAWLIGWFGDNWLVDWLVLMKVVGWLIDWLIGWTTGWLYECYILFLFMRVIYLVVLFLVSCVCPFSCLQNNLKCNVTDFWLNFPGNWNMLLKLLINC